METVTNGMRLPIHARSKPQGPGISPAFVRNGITKLSFQALDLICAISFGNVHDDEWMLFVRRTRQILETPLAPRRSHVANRWRRDLGGEIFSKAKNL